jgi:hypothetical protein
MHGLFQWGGGRLDTFRDSHTSSRTRVRLHFDVLHPHRTPTPPDFRLTHARVPGKSRERDERQCFDETCKAKWLGCSAGRGRVQRKSRPEWRQTRNHSTDCSINTPKHSGALQKRSKSEKPNGSQHAASTLLTCGVDTVKRQHPRRLPYAFVWLHELRLHEHRLLAMLPRCSLGAESSTSAHSPRARCPPPPPHR